MIFTDRAYSSGICSRPTYGSSKRNTSSSKASGLSRLGDRANSSGSDGSTIRVHDSFRCSSGGDARCGKSKYSNDSGDEQGCGDGSDESCNDGDHVEIGGWSLCVYVCGR